MTRPRSAFAVWLLARACSAVLGASEAAQALQPSALSIGRAGSALLDRLEASPGAPDVGSVVFGCDFWQVDHEAAIGAAAIRTASRAERWAWALAVDGVQSPIHSDLGCAFALQRRRGGAMAGLGVELRRLQFPATSLARFRVRAGAGARRGHIAACAAGEFAAAGEPPRLALACAVSQPSGFGCNAEFERRAGLPAGVRVAMQWDAAPLRIACGYDVASHAAAFGVTLAVGRLEMQVAMRVHPDLGLSPAWSCEWR